MRVALNAHFWGRATTGSGQYLHQLITAFRAHHRHLILTLIGDARAAARHREWPLPPGVEWRTARTPFDRRSPNLAKLWFEQVAFPRAAGIMRADLIHVPYFAPPLRASRPLVATIHDLIPLLLPEYRGGPFVRAYSRLVALAARRVDRVLVDSDASRRDVSRLLHLEPRKVRTIYLGVEARFHPQPSSEIMRIRRALNLPEMFVLYLGGFDIRKQVPALLAAAAGSSERWPLLLAGRPPERDTPFAPDPGRVARELNVTERVRVVGWVAEEDKPALLSAATVFAFPSRYEGFGLPVLEALACGAPTVTTTAASLPELAGDAAVTVDPRDTAALATAIDVLWGDKALRERLAARGPRQAEPFTWERCAAETATAYACVCEAAGP